MPAYPSPPEVVAKASEEIYPLLWDADETEITRIPTTRDLEAIVDRRFGSEVLKYRWYAQIAKGHLAAVADVKGSRVSLQRLVLFLNGAAPSLDKIRHVSFKNKVTYDCRLENLEHRVGRQATMRNRRGHVGGTSQYKGVFARPSPSKSRVWTAQISDGKSSINLGRFGSEIEAALVYDAAAYLLFDGAGFYNFPDECPNPDARVIANHRIQAFRARKRRKAEEVKD